MQYTFKVKKKKAAFDVLGTYNHKQLSLTSSI